MANEMLPQTATTTPAGVKMSPRMSRVYSYLNAENVPLTPFSTDAQVERLLPAIGKAIAKLITAMGKKSTPERIDCLADLRAIVARVPAARVGAERIVAQHNAKRQAEHGLIAVAQSSPTTGAVVYWRLHGDVELAKLEEHATTAGIDAGMLPQLPAHAVALTRAAKEVQARDVLVRKHPEGGYAIVRQRVIREDGAVGRTLDFDVVGRAYLAFDGEIEIVSIGGAEIGTEAARIREEYTRARRSLSTVDVSAWLVSLAARVGAVSLREGGGVYFFPAGSALEALHKVKAALAPVSSHVIEEIPAARSMEAIGAVVNALAVEIAAEITLIENEANDPEGMGSRKAANRMAEIDAMTHKTHSYTKLLGDLAAPMLAPTLAKLKAMREKVAALSTRTNQLEID